MIAMLLNIIFFTFNVLFSLCCRAIFTLAAHLIVLVIQKFKAPGDEAKGMMESFGDSIKACLEYLSEFLLEATSTLVSTGFDVVKEAVTGSAVGAGSAIAGLVESTRNSLQGLFETSEVFEGFSEMIWTMLADFLSHYKDAVGYVMENIR